MVGSLLVFCSLFLCQYSNSFWSYMILYSALYGTLEALLVGLKVIGIWISGCGIGITQSSNALALNTYFKEKRRVATGFSWTTTAMGPIVWPYIIVALNSLYGMEGTLLIFAGFSLHAFVCSLLLQPVEWHTKFRVCFQFSIFTLPLAPSLATFWLAALCSRNQEQYHNSCTSSIDSKAKERNAGQV